MKWWERVNIEIGDTLDRSQSQVINGDFVGYNANYTTFTFLLLIMANVNLNSVLSLLCYNNEKTNNQTVFFQTKDVKLQRMTRTTNRPTILQVNSIEQVGGPQGVMVMVVIILVIISWSSSF